MVETAKGQRVVGFGHFESERPVRNESPKQRHAVVERKDAFSVEVPPPEVLPADVVLRAVAEAVEGVAQVVDGDLELDAVIASLSMRISGVASASVWWVILIHCYGRHHDNATYSGVPGRVAVRLYMTTRVM